MLIITFLPLPIILILIYHCYITTISAISTWGTQIFIVSDLVVNRTVCFQLLGRCCFLKTTIQVKNCGDFIIYRLPSTRNMPVCARYCSTEIGYNPASAHVMNWQWKTLCTMIILVLYKNSLNWTSILNYRLLRP